jgi:HSP20 family molecular chaperone IbpA
MSAGAYLWVNQSRSFDVSGIETAGISAAYTDGVLTMTMPKKA